MRLTHQGIVVGRVDAADTGGATALDLVLQARPVAAREHRIGTVAQQEGTLKRGDRPVHRTGRRERAVIVAPALARPPVLEDLREVVVGGDQDVGERLVVAEQDIELRFQRLDQIRLEQQRLDFGVGRHDFHVPGFRDHALQTHGQTAGIGIGCHPFLEVARLADVEDLAASVDHPVDARISGHRPQFPPDERDPLGEADGRAVAFRVRAGCVVRHLC